MVLKQNSAFGSHAKIFGSGKFAAGYQCIENGCTPFVFHHLPAIQLMFNGAVWMRNDAPTVPLSNRNPVASCSLGVEAWRSRHKVIQRSHGPVTACAHFCIGVFGIVQDLVFRTKTSFSFGAGGDEVFDARIGAVSEFEFKLQIKSAVFFFSDDVTTIVSIGFFCVSNAQFAILDVPTLGREWRQVSRKPTCIGLAIPKQ